ncbi:hypothetical protein L2E82_04428 [Cichorium intybus]|uniref:Uncharacterized protein n=1 Tax=Cichorium intybus TaxID=13427 RepID=A0ACB9H6T1_CICIN|nr:hypothetical protein L2E82_04428 [Cichorium intybus]
MVGPIEESKIDQIYMEDRVQNGEIQQDEDGLHLGESPLMKKGISGKLKKLLSRNTPLSEKLYDEEKNSSSRISGGRENCGKGKNSIRSQSEPRATRSQTR